MPDFYIAPVYVDWWPNRDWDIRIPAPVPRDPLPKVDRIFAEQRFVWLDTHEPSAGLMTATQARHVRHLFDPNLALCISEFAERIGTSVPNASRLVSRMERNGLVTKSRGWDARVVNIRLTAKGRRQYERHMRRWREVEWHVGKPDTQRGASADRTARLPVR